MEKREKALIAILLIALFAGVSWYLGVWSKIAKKPPEEKITQDLKERIDKGGVVGVRIELTIPRNPFILNRLQDKGLEIIDPYPQSLEVEGKVNTNKIMEIAEMPQVSFIYWNPHFDTTLQLGEVNLEDLPTMIRTDGMSETGRGTTVIIMDSNIDCGDTAQNWDFECSESYYLSGSQFRSGNDPSIPQNPSDPVFAYHGSIVAEIIHEIAPDANIIAVSDVCFADVMDDTMDYVNNNILPNTENAVAHMSCGCIDDYDAGNYCPTDEVDPITDSAEDLAGNTLFSVSAGNEGGTLGRRGITAPGLVRNVLATGAINSDNEMYKFSSRGSVTHNGETYVKPNVVAYGCVELTSPIQGMACGTSFSGPQTAGMASLVWEANPNLGHEDIRNIMVQSAEELPGDDAPVCSSDVTQRYACESYDNDFGMGVIQGSRAGQIATSWKGQAMAIKNIFK